jgi:hypothetical protein
MGPLPFLPSRGRLFFYHFGQFNDLLVLFHIGHNHPREAIWLTTKTLDPSRRIHRQIHYRFTAEHAESAEKKKKSQIPISSPALRGIGAWILEFHSLRVPCG